jgi:hypothetical protein
MGKDKIGAQGLTLSDAGRYLRSAGGDELRAAIEVAADYFRQSGSTAGPDEIEIHHALFLLRRARGLEAPSFDAMRVELRSLLAA